MGRGRRKRKEVSPRPPAGGALAASAPSDEPVWGDYAVARYREVYSDRLVASEIVDRFGDETSVEEVARYLESRPDVVRRKEPARIPFSHDGVTETLTEARRRRLEEDVRRRIEDGEPQAAVDDWLGDELARYSRVEHVCYSDDPLFNDEKTVAAIVRRLKKWHRTVGRPVAGEGFEDLLAGVWSDVGMRVVLSPRNYDGADAHVEVQNQWVAFSLKSEARSKPSEKTIRLTSVAPHHGAIETPADCKRAIAEALFHLARYERMVYLLAAEERFPGDRDSRAHRYTILELPKDEISQHLLFLREDAFAPLFADRAEASERNTFTVPVRDAAGRRRFNVSVSRKPPRVSISGIDVASCELIASYWTEPVAQPERLSQDEARVGRWEFRDGQLKYAGRGGDAAPR